jgi:hypothetical protein
VKGVLSGDKLVFRSWCWNPKMGVLASEEPLTQMTSQFSFSSLRVRSLWRHFDFLEGLSFRVDGDALPPRDWFVTRLRLPLSRNARLVTRHSPSLGL